MPAWRTPQDQHPWNRSPQWEINKQMSSQTTISESQQKQPTTQTELQRLQILELAGRGLKVGMFNTSLALIKIMLKIN